MNVEADEMVIRSQGIDPDELRLCDCARCGKEVLGESLHPWYERLVESGCKMYRVPRPGVRIGGRPYCAVCGDSINRAGAG